MFRNVCANCKIHSEIKIPHLLYHRCSNVYRSRNCLNLITKKKKNFSFQCRCRCYRFPSCVDWNVRSWPYSHLYTHERARANTLSSHTVRKSFSIWIALHWKLDGRVAQHQLRVSCARGDGEKCWPNKRMKQKQNCVYYKIETTRLYSLKIINHHTTLSV